MLKTNTTFCAILRNRFFNQFISVKKISYTSIAANANKAIRKYKNALRKASLPLAKTCAAIGFSFFINVNTNAQCNTFQNADDANPLLSVIPKGKTIAGFAFADIDGDGDQDVYVSYYDETNSLHLFRNIGKKDHPVFKEDTNTGFGKLKVGCHNLFMQFVDIDGDGDLDYYASEDAQYYFDFASIDYYENIGTATIPRFRIGGDDPTPYVSSHGYQPFAFADVDGDGDYDLFVSDASGYGYLITYNQRVYYNSGTKKKGIFDMDDYFLNQIDGSIARTYYDWNKDGLLDFFGIDYYGYSYIKNVGSINKPHYVYAPKEGPNFYKSGIYPYRMIDLNNDGAPEAFDFSAHFSTLAPVAAIQDTIVNNGNKSLTILTSKNRNANYKYRWEYNGKTVPAANHYYLIASQAGIYTLYVTDDCGIGVSLNDTVSKNNVQIEQANDRVTVLNNATTLPFTVSSYPNPFTSTFTLTLSGLNERAESMVKITDLAGRVYLSQQMSASSVQLGQRLPHGIYTIQVWQEGKMIYHTIILK